MTRSTDTPQSWSRAVAKKPRKDIAALKTFEQEAAERNERLIFESIQTATKPVDALLRETDQRWGIDTLPTLVTPELAAKYGKARALLTDAVRQQSVTLTVKHSDTVIRGVRALEQAARDAGHTPQPPEIIHRRDDNGNAWKIVTDPKQYDRAIAATGDPIKTVTIEELLCSYAAMRARSGDLVDKVKSAYPGATVIVAKITAPDAHNDDIPF